MKDQPTLFDFVTSDDGRNRHIQLDSRQRSALIAALEVGQGGTGPTPEQVDYLVSGAKAILQWAVGARATMSALTEPLSGKAVIQSLGDDGPILAPAPPFSQIPSTSVDAQHGHEPMGEVGGEAQHQPADECRDTESRQLQAPHQSPPEPSPTGRGP